VEKRGVQSDRREGRRKFGKTRMKGRLRGYLPLAAENSVERTWKEEITNVGV